MKKIGIDIRCLMSPLRAGVGEYTHELLSAIFKLDKENQYWLFYNSHTDVFAHIPLWSGSNIHYVATKWPNKLFNAFIKIFGWPKLDKLISRNGKLDYFFSPNFNFTALSKDTKNILTVHDLSFKFFPQFFSLKQKLWHWAINPKKQCQQASFIITPSENTKRDIVDYYKIPAEKIKVAGGGLSGIFVCHSERSEESLKPSQRDPSVASLSQDDIRKKYNLPNKFILCLGAVESRKNIIGLIEAFEKFSKTTTGYSLVIAGSGRGWKNKKIYARALASPLRNNIEFIGYVDAQDKPTLYSMSELFVYPSFYEGFGFPVLEAMACGVPVITSNRSSLPEITEGAAYLINPNRPAEIAAAITKLISDTKLREYFIKKGLEQVKKFSWQAAAQKWLDILNKST
ncbi:MAG TPA: glycosyltransferase family 1 protein [Candidatus Udaeobacter sp.]|nr:glycosyltransferase family 1 protein [Candidatus Udaeobacter sp.]